MTMCRCHTYQLLALFSSIAANLACIVPLEPQRIHPYLTPWPDTAAWQPVEFPNEYSVLIPPEYLSNKPHPEYILVSHRTLWQLSYSRFIEFSPGVGTDFWFSNRKYHEDRGDVLYSEYDTTIAGRKAHVWIMWDGIGYVPSAYGRSRPCYRVAANLINPNLFFDSCTVELSEIPRLLAVLYSIRSTSVDGVGGGVEAPDSVEGIWGCGSAAESNRVHRDFRWPFRADRALAFSAARSLASLSR